MIIDKAIKRSLVKYLVLLLVPVICVTVFADEPENNRIISQNPRSNIDDGLIISNIAQNDNADLVLPLDVTDWTYSIGASMLSSPRIADIDGDGVLDIICTTYGLPPNPYWSGIITILDIDSEPLPGWPITTGGPIPASAAIGDVDNDGDMEIVVGDWSSMYVFNHDGTNYPGWPIGTGISESPALADLDGDNDLEIIYPSNSILYVRHHDGSYFEGFPVSAPEDIGSAAIGDIDNDGELEIVAGTLAGPVGPDPYEVYVWNTDGTVLEGFPVATSGTVKSTPALGDVDNDGMLEIVVAAYDTSNQDYLYCWDHEGNSEQGWPVRAGYCRLSSPALGDIDNDGDLEIFIGGLMTSPYWMEIL
ncbi:MAG: VCBS repeat-containing protein, partial [candidate division Zixibacteria bacterium]|nr:VCBS repeat-containing protein [candidate division Zixibacteria bacterium]